ncbi:DUF1616 domain-containing protein [Methanosarcina sp. Z-7115]|uniref:DUF1616 domain-containing protein n=1 Tax=Methanosarcina baikalica TaxID=3073890 RepID=A0ABU2D3X2_9EURY|nr:DUF1616 domain-containing protein [Methanosarcina sp. Z-7115]MDR7666641.1 DUF1616 domain-containing protein [Methanosarcina sp. Z-7115]
MKGKNSPRPSDHRGLVLLTDIFVLISGLNETVLRNIPGLPLVLFLFRYALVATLFSLKSNLEGIDTALSFGVSIKSYIRQVDNQFSIFLLITILK